MAFFWDDAKYAARLLLKEPAFTLLTTVVLATGIGLSVYMCSFLYTMAYRALPLPNGDRIIEIRQSPMGFKSGHYIDLHDYTTIRSTLTGVSNLSVYQNYGAYVAGRDGIQRFEGIAVDPNIFQITQVEPILGRRFTHLESRRGAERVAMIGYDMWQNHFGADPNIIGQSVRVNKYSHRIIGVMPAGFYFPKNAEIWLPLRRDLENLRLDKRYKGVFLALMDKGVPLSHINRQLNLATQRIWEETPEKKNGKYLYADTLPKVQVGNSIAVVNSFFAVAGLILLLAGINVGNLLLTRAIARRKETAIRIALGAGQSRVVAQMVWEALLICCIGGFAALMLVGWGLEKTQVITRSFSADKPTFWYNFGIDQVTVLLFLTVLLLTLFLSGVLPAWRNASVDCNAILRDGTRNALGKKEGGLHNLLVISEIFLCVTVLITAILIVVSAYRVAHAENGADTENVLLAKLSFSWSKYQTIPKKSVFLKTLKTNLQNEPGIESVAIASRLPGQRVSRAAYALGGKEYNVDGGKNYPRANYVVVMPGSLAGLGVELVEGRYFTSGDTHDNSGVALVTESFVQRHFDGSSPIGRQLRITEQISNSSPEGEWLTIVGVVEHTVHGRAGTSGSREPTIFRPITQATLSTMTVAIKTSIERPLATKILRDTVASIDPELPAYRIETYEEGLSRSAAPLQFMSDVSLFVSFAALLLAATGIYGVMSNAIYQRTREIGLKRALGAQDHTILFGFLRSGGKMLAWGGVPGIVIGGSMAHTMSTFMGIGAGGLLGIITLVTLIICSVVFLAIYIPVKRALTLEPSDALRYE